MPILESPVAPRPVIEHGVYARHAHIERSGRAFRFSGLLIARILRRSSRIALKLGDVDLNKRYLVVSNHQTWLDPTVVTANIPLKIWNAIGHPRAFANNRFFAVPLFGFFLRSIGAFPAREHHSDPWGLEYAKFLLTQHQSIIIFPEGRITLHRENPARRGVQELAHELDVEVIPVHLAWKRAGLRSFYRIAIGRPFDAHEMTAQEILDRIYSLPI